MRWPTSSEELTTLAVGNDLYTKLIEQINKDLSLVNLDYSFSASLSPHDLKIGLENFLKQLFDRDHMGFLNLMYRIDVAEDNILKSSELSQKEFIEHATFLVLLREWKKVWLRSNHKT